MSPDLSAPHRAGVPAGGKIMAGPARRLARLRQHLEDHTLSAALLTRTEHLRYFAGSPSGDLPAALVVTPDAAVLVVAAERTAVSDALQPLEIDLCTYRGYDASCLVDRPARLLEALGRVVRRLGVRGRLGVEATHVAHAALQAIPELAPQDLGPILSRWRSVKDGAEQTLIRRRVAVLDGAFDSVRAAIRPGASERGLLAAAHAALLDQVEEPLLLRGNLASGLRTTEDNPRATGRRLERGDLVLVDLYPVLDGYAADCTRTFVVGPPDPLQRERYAILEAALAAAESRLKPGVAVADVDEAVRATLRAAGGYDTTMTHHTGHGLGLQAWEEPWIGPGAAGRLAEGMTIAIEPGLYLPGWGGMRLEGNYLVTATGFDRLDRFPSTLIAVDG